MKNVYEAVRKGPKWNSTLFVITYDEYGNFDLVFGPRSTCFSALHAPCAVPHLVPDHIGC